MPGHLKAQIYAKIDSLKAIVDQKLEEWKSARNPVAFKEMELDVHADLRGLADDISELLVKDILTDPVFQAETSAAARASGKLRDVDRREPKVTLLGGKKIKVSVEYFRQNNKGRRGRKRKSGKRGKQGVGLYPALAALGIWFGVTPALAGEVCRQVADSDSVRAGRAALERRGINLGHKKTLRIVNRFSGRAVKQRQRWLGNMRQLAFVKGPLQGKRVVISTDGGRLRERRASTRGRRRPSGHRGYQAPWREPKLLVIYVIGEDGKAAQTFRPIYDGTLHDCNAIFEMFVGYLKALGVHEAQELIVVADGAKWIWERIDDLIKKTGINPDKVKQVIDWCHAVETLHKIANAPAKWTESRRAKWMKKAKRLLHAGKIDKLVEMIDMLASGRRAKAVNKHRNYFAKNVERMQYKVFEKAHIPTGSGAIESAVRRIVNMRMKNNGTFWKEVNAEGMLMLRSYLKAGRFDDLINWSLTQAAPWWQQGSKTCSSPINCANV
jgi:hypothetical protein